MLLDTSTARGDAHGGKPGAELNRWEARASRRQLRGTSATRWLSRGGTRTLLIVPSFAAMAGMRTHVCVRQAAPMVMRLDVNSILTYVATITGRGTSACHCSWTSLAGLHFLSHRPYGLGKPQIDVWNIPVNSRINYGGLTGQESLITSTSHSCQRFVKLSRFPTEQTSVLAISTQSIGAQPLDWPSNVIVWWPHWPTLSSSHMRALEVKSVGCMRKLRRGANGSIPSIFPRMPA